MKTVYVVWRGTLDEDIFGVFSSLEKMRELIGDVQKSCYSEFVLDVDFDQSMVGEGERKSYQKQ